MNDYIGDRIRDLRIDADLKQYYMAKKIKIGINAWCQYEKNKRTPNVDRLKAIANELKVSMDYLVGTTDKIYDPNDDLFKLMVEIYCSLKEDEKENLIDVLSSDKKKKSLISILKNELNEGR